jgi:hypothetical protein
MASDGSRTTKENYDDALTYDEIKALISGLMRYPNLLRDATRVGLESSMFTGGTGPGELKFCFLFGAIQGLTNAHGAFTPEMLITQLRSWRSAGQLPLSDDDFNYLIGPTGFIYTTCEPNPAADAGTTAADKSYVTDILRRFMNDRLVKSNVQKVINAGSGIVVSNLEAQLAQFTRQAQAVQFLGRAADNSAMMPAYGTEIELPPAPTPSTLPWVDQYIDGFRPGDIIGVLGPYSGGKTTALSVAAVRMAQQFYVNNENKLSVFIGYEDGGAKMKHMFWSAASHVNRNMFVAGSQFWEQFSTRDTLKDYDRELPENKNGEILVGERERWDAAKIWMDRNFVFLDFSANASSGGHGNGGVAEILAVLQQLAESRGMSIGFVAIDYAGLLLNRQLSKNDKTKNMEQVWRPMQMLPDELRTNVSVPLNCTIMLAHQLAGGDIKKIPVYRYVDHLDAQGSKAFAENLHACLCINTRDAETRVSTINWSKIRSGVPRIPTGLIRMDDVVVDMHLVNEQYKACEAARKIIKRGDVEPLAPDDLRNFRPPTRRVMQIDRFADEVL